MTSTGQSQEIAERLDELFYGGPRKTTTELSEEIRGLLCTILPFEEMEDYGEFQKERFLEAIYDDGAFGDRLEPVEAPPPQGGDFSCSRGGDLLCYETRWDYSGARSSQPTSNMIEPFSTGDLENGGSYSALSPLLAKTTEIGFSKFRSPRPPRPVSFSPPRRRNNPPESRNEQLSRSIRTRLTKIGSEAELAVTANPNAAPTEAGEGRAGRRRSWAGFVGVVQQQFQFLRTS